MAEQTNYSDLTIPATGAEAVSPNDNTDLTYKPTRGLYIGGAGDVVVIMSNGVTVTFSGAVAGSVLPIQVNRVKSTSTTATNIVALY